jgi:hypothetical protein
MAGGKKKSAKKSAARKAAAKHPELGKPARFLASAAAGFRSGRVVAHDGHEATIEHADGSQTRRKVGEYELTRG